jgi:hypothetical protein
VWLSEPRFAAVFTRTPVAKLGGGQRRALFYRATRIKRTVLSSNCLPEFRIDPIVSPCGQKLYNFVFILNLSPIERYVRFVADANLLLRS